MLDLSRKMTTLRIARARAVLKINPSTADLIREKKIPKGDPLETAKVAAMQAAKETSRIIPYCHPMPLEHVEVALEVGRDRIEVDVTVKAVYRTGVEMEALTAAAVAALTLYDMMKMLDKEMEISGIRLLSKKGGKSSFRERASKSLRSAVVVASDSAAAGDRDDRSGRMITERLKEEGIEVTDYRILPDERETIADALRRYADEMKLDMVITTGGTGFGPRDTTPEALADVMEKEAPGISETLRGHGQARTPFAMLSRGRAGIRGHTMMINLPGSEKGAREALDALFPGILHAFPMIRGAGHDASGASHHD